MPTLCQRTSITHMRSSILSLSPRPTCLAMYHTYHVSITLIFPPLSLVS